MLKIKLFMAYFLLVFVAGCSDDIDPDKSNKQTPVQQEIQTQRHIKVAVVNYPLKYFAQQIGMAEVEVIFLAGGSLLLANGSFPLADGSQQTNDPAYWKPSGDNIRVYQQADVIFLNGANYARWVNYASLPEDRLVNTSKVFAQNYIPVKDDISHSHGPKGEHSHGTLAFTTWLDMQQAIQQADAIRTTLVKLKPDRENYFNQNFNQLKNKLEATDQQLKAVMEKTNGAPVIFSHPVYQYFQRAYHVNGISMHWEPDEMPNDNAITMLSEKNKAHTAKWMIWEDKPLLEIENMLKKMNIQIVIFQPVSTTPAEGDFISVMQDNIRQLELME